MALAADGRAGWARGAPYDRIVVTAAADRIYDEWSEQLREGGRLVVPLAGPALCFAYEKRDGQLTELSQVPAAFVPLRERPGDAG
jgi:protein-L-isoaspartate(D-aspartate) O-methyltransferase